MRKLNKLVGILKKAPVLRIFLAFGLGIIAGLMGLMLSDSEESILTLASVCLLFLILIFLSKVEHKTFNLRWISGALFFILWFFVGYWRVGFHYELDRPSHFSKVKKQAFFIAELKEPFQETARSNRTIAEIIQVRDSLGGIFQTCGKTMLYLDVVPNFKPKAGDLIYFSSQPEAIRHKVNPWGFDYPEFLARKNIFHQLYLKKNEVKIQPRSEVKLIDEIKRLRAHFIEKTRSEFSDVKAFGVFAALVLGYRSAIDPEVQSSYANAGTMHVLAVSGLHVGILYFILSLIGKVFGKRKWGKIMRLIFVLAGIWFFAFLTGLSPSIWRAAIMFSLVVVADNLNRNSNIFNTLATSALIILANDPTLLLSVGFQLSYLAVLGIVLLFPHLYQLWVAPNKLLDYCWGLICVSIAAQTAVLPLSLFYFNQMPLYFIPANLVVIPSATVALIGGLIVLISSFIAPIFQFIVLLEQSVIQFQNAAIGVVGNLPFSTFAGLYVDQIQLIVLYVLLIGVFGFLITKQQKLFWLANISIFILLGWFTFKAFQLENKQELVVFHQNYKPIITYKIGGTGVVFISDTSQRKSIDFNVLPYFLKNGINEPQVVGIQDSVLLEGAINQNGFMMVNKRKLVCYDGGRLPHADILVTSAYHFKRKKEIISEKPFQKVVVIGNLPEFEKNEKFHFTQIDGPFMLSN